MQSTYNKPHSQVLRFSSLTTLAFWDTVSKTWMVGRSEARRWH